MAQFRKKPVVIEAIRCREAHYKMGKDWYSLPKWFIDGYEGRNEAGVSTIIGVNHPVPCIEIVTLEGVMRADINDWIVKGAIGEIYPCKPEAFEASFEQVINEQAAYGNDCKSGNCEV